MGELESEEGMHRIFGRQPEQCLISSADAVVVASASDPAVILEPSAAAEVMDEKATTPVETTTTTTTTTETEIAAASSESNLRPVPVPAPGPMDEFPNPLDEPSALESSSSSATSVLSRVALSLALFIVAVMM